MNIYKNLFAISLINLMAVGAMVGMGNFKSNKSKDKVMESGREILGDTTKIIPSKTLTNSSKTGAVTPTIDNRCVIVVDGQKYDVSQFRNQHSGGDIFKCGTDMSTVFHDQHTAKYLDIMAKYKIN